MRGTIDRFEGDFAVVELEDGTIKNFTRAQLPIEAKEGDILRIGHNISIDIEETINRKKYMEKKTKDMWQ